MTTVNPFRGVVFHWLGGLASGSFYVPFRGVRKWAWEVYWLAGGLFSWIIAPWILASVKTNDLLPVLRAAPPHVLLKAYVFGALWGVLGLATLILSTVIVGYGNYLATLPSGQQPG